MSEAVKTEKEKPDYRAIAKKDAPEGAFPAPMSGEYRVHIAEDAYMKMKAHAAQTNEVELCGVLIGSVRRDALGSFLVINAVIEGQGANNYGAQVTFTHQTWEHINTVKDRDYAKERIVGWYHTHPGFGIFLSSMDVFIQENYFNHPYQVAIVIETKQNQEGCFAWVDGKSTPLTRYWAGNTEIKLTTGSTSEFVVADTPSAMGAMGSGAEAGPGMPRPPVTFQPPPQEPSRMAETIMSLLLTVLAFSCGLFFGQFRMREQFKAEELASVQDEMYSLVEFAAINATASKDFAQIDEKVAQAGQKLAAGDAASAGKALADARADLEGMQKTYSKKKQEFRDDLEKMENTKRRLSDKVDLTSRREDLIESAVAQLIASRAMDMLPRENGKIDVSKLTDRQRAIVRNNLDMAFRMLPVLKEQFDPKDIDAIYGDGKPEIQPKPDDGSKSESPPKVDGK